MRVSRRASRSITRVAAIRVHHASPAKRASSTRAAARNEWGCRGASARARAPGTRAGAPPAPGPRPPIAPTSRPR